MSAALTRRAALASVTVAIALGLLKGWAAWATGSVAVLASLADSALDLLASFVTLLGVHVAGQPASARHRFGHGKAEPLAALFQVAMIAVSATLILAQALQRLMAGNVTAAPEYGIAVSVVAIVVTFALTRYQSHVVRRTGSVAIETDAIHYSSDMLLNAAVIAALVLESYLGLSGADPVVGIAIALWLFWGALRASSRAIGQLMDREWPEAKRRRFVEVAARRPELKGLHDLRTRSSGMQDFVQFHIWMDPNMTVAAAHEIVAALEDDLRREFPGTEILIHIDPEGQVDEPDNPLVEADEIAKLKELRQ